MSFATRAYDVTSGILLASGKKAQQQFTSGGLTIRKSAKIFQLDIGADSVDDSGLDHPWGKLCVC